MTYIFASRHNLKLYLTDFANFKVLFSMVSMVFLPEPKCPIYMYGSPLDV